MAVSEHDPSDALLPDTPEGYRDPVEFNYPLLVLLGLVAVVVPISILVFGALFGAIQGPDAFDALFEVTETETSVTFGIRSADVLVAIVGAIVLTTVLHELVHGLVYRRLGYRVSYGAAVHLGAFYAGAFHQFQRREDGLLVGIAPLLVLDLVYLLVLFVPIPAVAFGGFVGLVFNTAGATGDVYLLATLLRMPDGTLLYDSDVRHSYVFYPEVA